MNGLNERRQGNSGARIQIDRALLVWRGAGVVLIGETSDDRWVVARGWLGADQLTDVRRWVFASPDAFGSQFRRLTFEATGNADEARAAGAAATEWALALTTA